MSGVAIGAAQIPARWNDPKSSLADIEALLGSGPKLDLVLLPEACITGYVSPTGATDLSAVAEPVGGETTRTLSSLAARHGVHLAGPLVEIDSGRLFNTILVFDPAGQIVARYRKRHPWYVETWATPGEGPAPLFEIKGVSMTIAICFDLHFLARESAAALRKADVLLFASAWVERKDSRPWRLASLARAFDMHVVNANWGEGEPKIAGQGRSCIVAPSGDTIAVADEKRALVRARIR